MSRVVCLTRLRSRWMIPRFLPASIPVMLQLPRRLPDDEPPGARAEAMKAFHNAGAHGVAMASSIDGSIGLSGAAWAHARLTVPSLRPVVRLALKLLL